MDQHKSEITDKKVGRWFIILHIMLSLRVFSTLSYKFYKHITKYNTYQLRYNTTKTMLQGAK